MFWPSNDPNIIPFHMTNEIIDDFSRNIVFRKVALEGHLTTGEAIRWSARLLASNVITKESHAPFVRDFMHIWVLSKLLADYPPTIVSPSGSSMKLHETFFYHGDRLDWVNIGFPLEENSDLQHYFRLVDTTGFSWEALAARFCFLNPLLGTLEIKNNSKMLCQNFTNSEAEAEMLVSVASEFRGWALYWQYDQLPTPLDLAEALFPQREFDWKWGEFFGDEEKLGTRFDPVIETLEAAYPDGKTDPWHIVEKKTGYSRRHIERALKTRPEWNWKNGRGQT